ncbi:MAG: ferric reductase-like transmembrane domain-containing protein [Aromatoleum sp.]|jgi:predicted ferric reductase|uniref:ferredoxin reductase family protein n=1 Tax=Aromatoleum sp. TaxID=2307007 RepID=UPI002893D797|nr:ferric reductase-like transmembrane domain-containing protein [Aromatoleum sp.]MDT3670361.1 ferric reductase-like transmembrane domain-containing protein [Aromatoleum sp.]
MVFFLSAFIALLTFAWGLAASVDGGGSASLPWLIREQALYLSGVLGIGLMSLAMALATRPTALERALGGMDRIFHLHKWAGILAAVFAALHWLIEMSDDLLESVFGEAGQVPEAHFGALLENLRDAGEELGEFAIYFVLGMVILSLWKRFPYKFWRHLHRAMPVLYLLLAFHAAVLAPPEYWNKAVGWLMAALLAAGTAASILALTGRIGRDRRARGVVASVSSPAPDITEVTCRLDAGWNGHRAGQFAFVGFDRFEGAHPFTIASADRGDQTVTFQIKALGDYTRRLATRIAVGQPVTVEGPYGRFLLERHNRNARQIWIAGGIGITPFLSWLDALHAAPDSAPQVELHYSTRNASRDPFVERLQRLCGRLPMVQLHIHDASLGATLTSEQLAASQPKGGRTEVWFCGPRQFGDQLAAGLASIWGRRLRFRREVFEMR